MKWTGSRATMLVIAPMLAHAQVTPSPGQRAATVSLSNNLAERIPIDRIAVSVGNQVITESELITDLRVTAFLDRVPVDLSPAAKRKSADRLVDQVLILKEASESKLELPAADPVSLLKQVKALYPSDAQYHADLARYQITEQDLSAHLYAGLRLLTFTDLRFRPATQVSDESLHAEYDKLVASQPAGKPPLPSFDDSRDELEKLLVGEKSTEALDAWLVITRATARIDYRQRVFEEGGQ